MVGSPCIEIPALAAAITIELGEYFRLHQIHGVEAHRRLGVDRCGSAEKGWTLLLCLSHLGLRLLGLRGALAGPMAGLQAPPALVYAQFPL
jgi:hypothetical protein